MVQAQRQRPGFPPPRRPGQPPPPGPMAASRARVQPGMGYAGGAGGGPGVSPGGQDMRMLHHKRKTKNEAGFRREGEGEAGSASCWMRQAGWPAGWRRQNGKGGTGRATGQVHRLAEGIARGQGATIAMPAGLAWSVILDTDANGPWRSTSCRV